MGQEEGQASLGHSTSKFEGAEAAAVIEDFEDADEAEAETEAEDATGVGHQGRPRDGLVLLDHGEVRVLEEGSLDETIVTPVTRVRSP